MIDSANISVVVQGDLRPDTGACLRAIRNHLPGAQVILSTYAGADISAFAPCCSHIVQSPDPGPQPPFIKNARAAPSNINRQIVTTQAGLAHVNRPYTLKLRTDHIMVHTGFLTAFHKALQADPAQPRLIVPSLFSRNIHGVSQYLFHVSDWLVFGRSADVAAFWSAPLYVRHDVNWFVTRKHRQRSLPTARRFRSRLTPEQHITFHYAALRGYPVPRYLNDTSRDLRRSCAEFYARAFLFATHRDLGFTLAKYDRFLQRPFQMVDTTGLTDWITLCTTHAPDVLRNGTDFLGKRPITRSQRQKRRLLLGLTTAARYPISLGVLASHAFKRIKAHMCHIRTFGI